VSRVGGCKREPVPTGAAEFCGDAQHAATPQLGMPFLANSLALADAEVIASDMTCCGWRNNRQSLRYWVCRSLGVIHQTAGHTGDVELTGSHEPHD